MKHLQHGSLVSFELAIKISFGEIHKHDGSQQLGNDLQFDLVN